MANIINNRSELLFLYEIENANPNGDPLNEKRPRFDTEDSKALVSDVRLKRTIRDYWYEYKGYDGTGEKDIFVSKRLENGDWSQPKPIGKPINTKLDDESPFIHPDGQTLYFMSKGNFNSHCVPLIRMSTAARFCKKGIISIALLACPFPVPCIAYKIFIII